MSKSYVASYVRRTHGDISTFLQLPDDLNSDALGLLRAEFDSVAPDDAIASGPASAYSWPERIPMVHLPHGGWVTVVSPVFVATFKLPNPSGFVAFTKDNLAETPPRNHPHLLIPQRTLRIVTDGAVFLIEGEPLADCVEFGWRLHIGQNHRLSTSSTDAQ